MAQVGYTFYRQTQSGHNWKKKPGGYDTTKSQVVFPSQDPVGAHCPTPDGHLHGPLGLPWLRAYKGPPPDWVLQYHRGEHIPAKPGLGMLHFFTDDYRFESIWQFPQRALQRVSRYPIVATPDFSMPVDAPVVVQLYNLYRNRWMGAYWQSHEVDVIPTLSFGSEPTIDALASGIEPGGWILVQFRKKLRRTGNLGWWREAMLVCLDRLKPCGILVHGTTELLPKLPAGLDVREFPVSWETWGCAYEEYKTPTLITPTGTPAVEPTGVPVVEPTGMEMPGPTAKEDDRIIPLSW